MEQCEECLGYFEEDNLKQPVICLDCLDKLRLFDIRDHERTYLIQTLQELLNETDINVIHGRISVALNYCGEKVSELIKNDKAGE